MDFLFGLLLGVPLGAVGLLAFIREEPADTAEEVIAVITELTL